MDKKVYPPSKPPRVSVPVSAEVLVVFERLAKAGNTSTGRAMAEWMGDTIEAAEYLATTMERARAAPKIVVREMHAYALGLADETAKLMDDIRARGKADRATDSAAPRPVRPSQSESTPPSNTGVTITKATTRTYKKRVS